MDLRHEEKFRITPADAMVIRRRLEAVARRDAHAPDGTYRIRSLYFDDPADTALREKLDGVDRREKFRLRCYDGGEQVFLEKKSKWDGLGNKQRTELTRAETGRLLAGDLDWMRTGDRPLVTELYGKMRTRLLAPKTLVEYRREAFVYGPGNVRVTLDDDLRTGLFSTDFLDRDCVMFPAGDGEVILEVKWDAFLPECIRMAVQLEGRRAGAFSKYAACRRFD